MESGAGFFIVMGVIFLGWLMWSGKGAKENLLVFAWGSMLVIGTLNMIYLWLK